MVDYNGSIFAAGRTLEIAVALNLEPCFTPAESPESNGMAEAFVKTFKRDYVRVNPLPDARTALSRIDHWTGITTRNTHVPLWATAHRGSALHHFNSRVFGLTGATPLPGHCQMTAQCRFGPSRHCLN
jgi:transposase InsO family protein